MNIVKHPLVRLGFAILCVIVSIGLLRSIIGHLRRTDVVGESRDTLVKEQKRNQELKDRLKEATSAAFIEKQAREKLGMAREGETIVLIDKSQSLRINNQTGISAEKLSNWKRWWKLFF
jgi:cell division protein FtsB